MGAMKKLDHELSELIESINPGSPMLGDRAVNYEARDILLNEMLERGWVPPTMAAAESRRQARRDFHVTSIAIALGARQDWNMDDLSDAAGEIAEILVALGHPDPSMLENTAHYVELEANLGDK